MQSNINDTDAPFSAVNNSGFKFKFPNGWTVSIMWGANNYCSNKNLAGDPKKYREYKSLTAEVAAWHDDGRDWEFFESGTYIGWLTPMQVVTLLKQISAAS
jgi:hypothetical protein